MKFCALSEAMEARAQASAKKPEDRVKESNDIEAEGCDKIRQFVKEGGIKNWKPNFVDYLLLSFNTSTAFSPTDTPILSRWAKCISMIQAMISLTIVVMLAARAINILTPSASYLVS